MVKHWLDVRCLCQPLFSFETLCVVLLGAGISRDVFLNVMAHRLALVDSTEEVRQMFRAFDRGCRGFITRDDMRQASSQDLRMVNN